MALEKVENSSLNADLIALNDLHEWLIEKYWNGYQIIQELLKELESTTDHEERNKRKWLIFEALEKEIPFQDNRQLLQDWRTDTPEKYNVLKKKFIEFLQADKDLSFLDQNIFSFSNASIIKYYEMFGMAKEDIKSKLIGLYKEYNGDRYELYNFLIPLWQCNKLFGGNDGDLSKIVTEIILRQKESEFFNEDDAWAAFLFGKATNISSSFSADPNSSGRLFGSDIKIYDLWENIVLFMNKDKYLIIPRLEYENKLFERWEYVKQLWCDRYIKEKELEENNKKITDAIKEQFAWYHDISIVESFYLEWEYWEIMMKYKNKDIRYQSWKKRIYISIGDWKYNPKISFPISEEMDANKIYEQVKIAEQASELLEKYRLSVGEDINIRYRWIDLESYDNGTYIFDVDAIRNASSKYEESIGNNGWCQPTWTVNIKLELRISPDWWYEIKPNEPVEKNDKSWKLKKTNDR